MVRFVAVLLGVPSASRSPSSSATAPKGMLRCLHRIGAALALGTAKIASAEVSG
jgi:hypothetical protein